MARELNMTVDQMKRTMPNREFIGWGVYFGLLAQRQELKRR